MWRSASLAALVAVCGIAGGCTLTAAQQADLPHTYLQHALQAVQARDSAAALDQLDRAQSTWLSRNIALNTQIVAQGPTVVREMGRARQAIKMGRWDAAAYYIRTAMRDPTTLVPG